MNNLPSHNGRHFSLLIVAFLIFTFLACTHPTPVNALADAGIDTAYRLVGNWPQLPLAYSIGGPAGIGIDQQQHIFIFSRAGREWPPLMAMPVSLISGKTILEIDNKTGRLLNSWGDHFFIMPHGLTVDAADNIWVTDVGLQQVFKFSHNGQLLMTLGKARKAGNDKTHFNQPTGVAVAKDGSIYVSDGYGNSRIVKFSATGKYVLAWGNKGKGPGEFNIPHALELDDSGNVYVADRENHRIQVFDGEGRFLQTWEDKSFGSLCSVVFDKNSHRLVAVDDQTGFLGINHKGSDIILIDTKGSKFERFGRSGAYKGPRCWYHDVVTDSAGNIYVADILNNRVQKFENR